MARRKNESTTKKTKKWEFKGFINHQFTPKQITDALDWFETRTIILSDVLMDWADQGYKVSIGWDDYKNAYGFSATAKRTNSELDGYCIQFHHVEMHRLLCVSAFVLSELIANDAIQPDSGEDPTTSW